MQRESQYNQGTPRKDKQSASNLLAPKKVSTVEFRSSPTISNPTDMSRHYAIDLKNSRLKIKNMNRTIVLKKRKIKDENVELKNLQLMRAKEIKRMNKTIDKLAAADPSFIQGQDLSSFREFDAEKLNSSLSEFEIDEDIMDTVSVDTNISTPYSSRWASSSCVSEPASFFNLGSKRATTSKTSLLKIKSQPP